MAKTIALVFGAVFLLVGVMGFIPNPIVGMGAIFEVDMLHTWIHILTGVAVIAAGLMSEAASVLGLKIAGVVYALVAVLGFVAVTDGKILGLISTNTADNWLHVVLALALLGAGFWAGKKTIAMPMGQ